MKEQELNINNVNGRLNELERQRNDAFNQRVIMAGELETLRAQLQGAQELIEALQANSKKNPAKKKR